MAFNEVKTFFWAAIGSWIIFFFSSLLLTESLMRIMHLEILAAFYLVVGLAILSLNYILFKKTLLGHPAQTFSMDQEIHTFHHVIRSLNRIFWIIVVLVSMGLLVSLSTFLVISMHYFTSQTLDTVVGFLPLLFIIYLIFIIPSFLGINEINRLNAFFQRYNQVKTELGQSLLSNIEGTE
ncbi:MAG: hypothetical protein ACFFFG_17960 [Candidatus Thorarchaeota archaeon]